MKTRPAWVLTDALVVLGLVGLAELGLVGIFHGWGHLVVAEVAALLGLLVVLATIRLPFAVLVATVPLVALVFAGPVALQSQGLGAGVPDADTLGRVMQGTWTSWGELITTLPWVDLTGSPAMVPFLLGYFGAVLGGAMALRTRRVADPVLPLLVVLAVGLLLRRPELTRTTLLSWYPVAFAIVAVGWVVVRGLRVAPGSSARGAEHGRIGRGLSAAVVVAVAVAVAVPLTTPMSAGQPSSSGKALRGHHAALTDFSTLDSPLRRFRTFTDRGGFGNVHDKLLFTFTGVHAGERVRMVTLDTYDGREWLPGNNTIAGTTEDAFLRLDSRVDNPLPGRSIRAQVSVTRAYASAWIPAVGSLRSLHLIFADRRGQRTQMRYDLATSTAVLPTGLSRRDPYEITAVVPDDSLDASTPAWAGPGLTQVQGLARLNGFLPQVLNANIPPMHKVFLLAAYLREEGRYSDGSAPGEAQYKAGHDLHRLVNGFLMAPRPVGDDEQYAAAMALLANRVGVPARVVVGAVLPRDGKVRGADVHAWVELRVADGSWRTLPTREFMGHRRPRAQMSPPPPDQLLTPVKPPKKATAQPVTPTRKVRPPVTDEHTSSLVRLMPWLLLLLVALVVPVLKVLRRQRRRRRGRRADRAAGAWTELVDQARDLGVPVGVHASRPAQARTLVMSGGLPHQADDAVFAAEEPSEAAVTALWDQIMAERRELRAGRGLGRRLWAPFNPVSLFRSQRTDQRTDQKYDEGENRGWRRSRRSTD